MRALAAALVAVLAVAGVAGAIEVRTKTAGTAELDLALWPALGLDRPARKLTAAPVRSGGWTSAERR